MVPEAFNWQVYSPNGFVSTLFMFIDSDPLMDEDTVSPLFMRESMEKGGKPMLARQIRVAPSVTVVAFLSLSKTSIRPKQ